MKDVTIIVGAQGTGKTTLAEQMTNGRRPFYTSVSSLQRGVRVPQTCDVVVIDGISERDLLKSAMPLITRKMDVILILQEFGGMEDILRRKFPEGYRRIHIDEINFK